MKQLYVYFFVDNKKAIFCELNMKFLSAKYFVPLQQNARHTEVSSAFKSFSVRHDKIHEASEFRVALFIQKKKDLSCTTVNRTPG